MSILLDFAQKLSNKMGRILLFAIGFLFFRIESHDFKCFRILDLHFDWTLQSSVGHAYYFEVSSKGIQVFVTVGPCSFSFSCLFRFDFVLKDFLQSSSRQGNTIVEVKIFEKKSS